MQFWKKWLLIYRYFEGGVSSVYFWDLEYGFAGVVLIKKIGDGQRNIVGCWDSIHVIEIQEKVCCNCYSEWFQSSSDNLRFYSEILVSFNVLLFHIETGT